MRRDHTRNLKFLYGSNRVGVVPPITSLPCAGWTRSLMPGVFFVAFLSLPIRLLLNVGSIHPVVVWSSSAPKSRAHRTRSLLHSSPRRHRVRPPVPGTLQWLVHGSLPEKSRSLLAHASASSAQRAPHALGRERQFAESQPREPREGVGDGGTHGDQAAFPRALGAEGAAAVGVLHEAALERGRHVLGARHAVDEQRAVQQVPLLVDHLFEQRGAETLDDRALVLPLEDEGIDRAADVGNRDVTLDADGARLLVEADLGGADRHLPEGRAAAERRGGAPGRHDATADQLAAAHPEAEREHLRIREALVAGHHSAVL